MNHRSVLFVLCAGMIGPACGPGDIGEPGIEELSKDEALARARLVAPTMVTAVSESATSIRITWDDPNTNELSYRVERSESENRDFREIEQTGSNVTTFLDTGRTSGTRYYYRVRARGRAGARSDYSPVVSAVAEEMGCVPSTEVCNGLDDNCDGTIDEGFGLGAACDGADADLCNEGVTTCAGCSDESDDSVELCDGTDNDCDGTVDEEIPTGAPCDGPDDDLCSEGALSCSDGVMACSDMTGANNETCNGADDDCDGSIDEDFGLGAACDGSDADLCSEGVVTCSGCSDSTDNSSETCNGLDDDCDGTIDEGFTTGEACDGPDADLCNEGVLTCIGCSDATSDSAEVCDGLDNDCDGSIDEGIPTGASCDGTDGDLCNEGVLTCTGGATVCSDSTGTTTETCDGADNDCDGSIDEGIPTGAACDGSDGDLCNEGVLTCTGGAMVCSDSTSTNVESCNGLDDNCNGVVDDAIPTGASCDGPDGDFCNEGVMTCTGGAMVCSDTTGTKVETCNGLDDDCDGSIDEGIPTGASCDGPDDDLCSEGALSCSDGVMVCSDSTGTTTEICDGSDNDCDGSIDEGIPTGAACDGTDGDLCNEGVMTCTGGAMACSDSTGTAIEICNGLDDDCDGTIDEGVCGPVCGNGVIESGETCDPPSSCPSSCNDGVACTVDTLTGSSSTCNTVCSHSAITACIDNDGCCPSACSSSADNDCAAECGNGSCEGNDGETCPSCSADCNTGAVACGNGQCQSGETSSSCYGDCGPSPWPSGWTTYEDEVIALFNAHRAAGTDCPTSSQAPVPAVTLDTNLRRAAELHSWDMSYSNYFSHTSCNGRSPWTRASNQGTSAGGEIIAACGTTPAANVSCWMASQGHCAIIMSSSYTRVGVGYATESSQHRWTGMFGW